jgi:hypothetical protein
MADKAKLRAALIHWLWSCEDSGSLTDEELDSDEYEEFEQHLKAWACEFVGAHEPERDQCGIPAHDYCVWCGTSTPNAWQSALPSGTEPVQTG